MTAGSCASLLKDRRLAAIPIMSLSGAGSLATEAAALGAVAFLNKPFNVSQLLQLVPQHRGPPGA